MLLVENRNHVWRDLSRLVDMLSVKYLSEFDSSFFQAEVVCEHASIWKKLLVEHRNHDLFRLVDSECK